MRICDHRLNSTTTTLSPIAWVNNEVVAYICDECLLTFDVRDDAWHGPPKKMT